MMVMNDDDSDTMESIDVYIPKANGSIMCHAILMTIVVLVGIPIGYGLILSKNTFLHKIIQALNIFIVFVASLIAMIDFSRSNTIHARLGQLIIFFLIIQGSLVKKKKQTKKTNFNQSIQIVLLFCIVWFVGFEARASVVFFVYTIVCLLVEKIIRARINEKIASLH